MYPYYFSSKVTPFFILVNYLEDLFFNYNLFRVLYFFIEVLLSILRAVVFVDEVLLEFICCFIRLPIYVLIHFRIFLSFIVILLSFMEIMYVPFLLLCLLVTRLIAIICLCFPLHHSIKFLFRLDLTQRYITTTLPSLISPPLSPF